jgi:hypothetical protein
MQVRVFIIMEDGLIQNVLADNPDVVDVIVMDYDTDGATEDDGLTMVPQSGDTVYREEAALVSRWGQDAIACVDADLAALARDKFGEAEA